MPTAAVGGANVASPRGEKLLHVGRSASSPYCLPPAADLREEESHTLGEPAVVSQREGIPTGRQPVARRRWAPASPLTPMMGLAHPMASSAWVMAGPLVTPMVQSLKMSLRPTTKRGEGTGLGPKSLKIL